jgi:hypothetical protein
MAWASRRCALDRRGVKIETERPFFWSSGGWGHIFRPVNGTVSISVVALRVEIPGLNAPSTLTMARRRRRF